MCFYWPLSVLCVCVCGPSGTEVPRFDMCASIISLSKIAYLFGQRNKTTGRAVRVEIGGDWGGGGVWTKFEKGVKAM